MPIFDDLHGNLNDDFLADDPDNLKNLFIINKYKTTLETP